MHIFMTLVLPWLALNIIARIAVSVAWARWIADPSNEKWLDENHDCPYCERLQPCIRRHQKPPFYTYRYANKAAATIGPLLLAWWLSSRAIRALEKSVMEREEQRIAARRDMVEAEQAVDKLLV